jgi:hypothetical protein
MKKNFLKTICSIVLTVLLFSGCKKVTEEELKSEDPVTGRVAQDETIANTQNGDNNSCQLKHVDYGTGYTLDFKYNHKGLASEVLLSYSDGYFERHKIFYDRRDRLIRTRIVSSDGPVIIYDFYHSGDFITRANGYFEGTNEPWRDIRYSYNRKGQMTRLDDIVQELHMRYSYNNQGYNTHGELSFGTDLYYTYDYEFKIPNKNPFLAVNGVPFGFWDVFLPLWNKRWESSDRFVFYENGSPILVLDTDPDQTTMNTGLHNYLLSATKYDIISESFFTESMIYQNCGSGHDDLITPSSNAKKATGMNVMSRVKKIINGHSKNMKQELQRLKREYLYKNNAKQK